MTPGSLKDAPPFERHVKEVFQKLRGAFSELMQSVDVDPTRPQDASRQLGVHKNLAWKISRVIREPEPADALAVMPGREGFKIFLRSLQGCGADARLLDVARESLADFESLIGTHSGDRDTLELMLGSLAKEADIPRGETVRKSSFRGNSAVWGVQARVQLCVNIIAPSDDPEWADLAWLSGLIDFRRLRSDVDWPIASARKADDSGKAVALGAISAIDPAFEGQDVTPFLADFCSHPLPDIRIATDGDGLLRYELKAGPIGNTAFSTCVVGIVGRRFVRRRRAEGDTIGEHNSRLNTPAEVLIHDLYVHKDLDYAMHPQGALYSQLPSMPSYPHGGRDHGILPLAEKIQYLGAGPPDVLTEEIPNYSRQLGSVFEQLDWDQRDFSGFRLKMRYPPIPTMTVMRYDLP